MEEITKKYQILETMLNHEAWFLVFENEVIIAKLSTFDEALEWLKSNVEPTK